MQLQVNTEIVFRAGDELAAIHHTAASSILCVGLGEMVLKLIRPVETVIAKTTTVECWTEEHLVVVLLDVALELSCV